MDDGKTNDEKIVLHLRNVFLHVLGQSPQHLTPQPFKLVYLCEVDNRRQSIPRALAEEK